MHSKLEDVLREKERELKLHQKFSGLVRFCEDEVFPFTVVPLQRHIEKLTEFLEKLIPEPRDRTQEMFSGEVFVLLGTLYFHDMGAATKYGWTANGEILDRIDNIPKTFFLNTQISARLDIPEKALELINALIFSSRKIPIEWEIREGAKKAIVRNARVLGEIFNFAHLMWDIFSADAGCAPLRRTQGADLRLRFGDANLAIDSKEGIIHIKCSPGMPYQQHLLETIRTYVDGQFRQFKERVNGRLGFQYREIAWDIGKVVRRPDAPRPKVFPFNTYTALPYSRWAEASHLLDRLFQHGEVVVVGDSNAGKTTMINSFVVPQLRESADNVYYAEIWERPVDEIREAIDRGAGITMGAEIDIVSTCKKLVSQGPCFFIIDGCERLKGVSADEKEKFERFVRFCIDNENVYLIAIGDKDEFFEWYAPFRKLSLSAVFEVEPLGRLTADHAVEPDPDIIPLERLKELVEEIRTKTGDERELREIVYALTGEGARTLRRYEVSQLFLETGISHDKIVSCLDLLKDRGIVRKQELSGTSFYVLSTRHLNEPLHELLQLNEFAEKGRIRAALRSSVKTGEFLQEQMLSMIQRWKDRMVFSKAELGLILASMLYRGWDYSDFVMKAEKETRGFDYDFSVSLLDHSDRETRGHVIKLLSNAKDEGALNHLLAHLRNEKDPEVRSRIVKAIAGAGKKKSVVALFAALIESGDRDRRLEVIESICALPVRASRELLIEAAELEKDVEIIDQIDALLAKLESN